MTFYIFTCSDADAGSSPIFAGEIVNADLATQVRANIERRPSATAFGIAVFVDGDLPAMSATIKSERGVCNVTAANVAVAIATAIPAINIRRIELLIEYGKKCEEISWHKPRRESTAI